jgi:hypothetical protein
VFGFDLREKLDLRRLCSAVLTAKKRHDEPNVTLRRILSKTLTGDYNSSADAADQANDGKPRRQDCEHVRGHHDAADGASPVPPSI